MKINVGDYVRTKYGIIGKIESKQLIGYNDWIIDTLYYNDDEIIDDWTCGVKEYDILKSSPNIIDLIEVKDIITYQCISDDYDFEKGQQYTYQINNNDELESFKEAFENEDLKLISIVTKEQFSQMEYKIGE